MLEAYFLSTYVELEIQNLLNECSEVDEVGRRLIQNIESSPDYLTLDNINSLARFLNLSGLHVLLVEFISRHLDNESFSIPWPYFLEALQHTTEPLNQKIVAALIEGIEEENAEAEAARSSALLKQDPRFEEWRGNRKYKIHKDFINNKKNLLDQLVTLRTQQLFEQEKQLLQKLQKLYPNDQQILSEANEHKQRYALEILVRRGPPSSSLPAEEPQVEPDVEKAKEALMISLHERVQDLPEMAEDFAVIAYMIESYEDALLLLEHAPESASQIWFRLEILLKCRRFVELLNDLAKVELVFTNDPETFFATAYLRAQALWGLGQKHTALQVIEGLITARPHYRAAGALLSIWSGQ